MIRNALTVDLEEYFQVSNFDGVIGRDAWDAQPSRVVAQTELLLELFDQHAARATFFVLGWLAERQPALVRRIAERGHEIACHGFGHERLPALGPARFREDLKRARAAIEDACGIRVQGYRAPSFSLTAESLWALEILVEQDFHYDSSIFPIRHPRYGIPGFARLPVLLELPGGERLREFPPTTFALGPLRMPLAGGAYLRLLPPRLFRAAFERLVCAGEPTLLYLHPWEIDPEQPRQPVSWAVRINHYYHLDRVIGRLRALLERFRFASMGEVLAALECAGELPRCTPPAVARTRAG